MIRQFYLLLTLLLLLTSCQGEEVLDTTIPSSTTEEASTEATSELQGTIEENGTVTEAPIPTVFAAYESLLTTESTAADLGQYITAHIEEVSAEEAEEMIQWLLIYQTELYQKYSYNAYESPYADALNNTLGGVLDPTKIINIEDEDIRNDYQNMVHGLMTIVRYEETPSAETDWSAIAAYEDFFSDDFAYLVNLRAKYAKRYMSDAYTVAEDIIILEDMIHQTSNSFHLNQLTNLHNKLVGDLLVGPEGYYIGTFVGKSDHHYDTLMSFSDDFSHTDFGQLLGQLDANDWTDYRGPLDLYDDFTAFSLKSDFYWEALTINDVNVQLDLKSLNSDTQRDIAESVNSSIQSTIDYLGAQTNGTYAGSMNVFYSDDAYFTAYLSLHYLKTPDQTAYVEQPVTISLTTGKAVDIGAYLSMTPDEALQTVNTLTGSDLTQIPYLEFTSSGIALRARKGDTSDTRYAILSLKDLVPFLTQEQLMRQP